MILVLYNIILITNFKLIEMCIKSSLLERGGDEAASPPYGGAGLWCFILPQVLLPPFPFLSFHLFHLSFSSSQGYPPLHGYLSEPYGYSLSM